MNPASTVTMFLIAARANATRATGLFHAQVPKQPCLEAC